jgi:transcription elongation GreA/GreB family factor
MTATKMTMQMRQALTARLAELEERIRALEEDEAADDDVDAGAVLGQLKREHDRLSDALADAVLIDAAPFDTQAIEIGDIVTVRSQHGVVERFVLVDGGFGSRVEDDWVSVSSPMGTALLGSGVGDEISVKTPRGVTNYLILEFERSGSSIAAEDSSPAGPAA